MKSFQKFWSRDNRDTKRTDRNRKRRLGFESLEERRMLDGDPPFELVFADTALVGEPVNEPLPGDFRPELAPPLPMTTDEGDHYFYFDEQIDLLRALDEFVVAIDAEVDAQAVLASLTGSGGVLEDYEQKAMLDDHRFVLTRPDEVAFVSIDLSDVENNAGVAWAAPVFVGEESGNLAIATDEITLELKPGVDPEDFFATGFVSWKPFIGNSYIAVVGDGGVFTLDTANALSIDEDVEWAQPNFYVDVVEFQNDPLFGNQWTLNNTGQFGARNDADGDVLEAWNTTTGSADVVIAVLDSGVQLNHPDLAIRINQDEIPPTIRTQLVDVDDDDEITFTDLNDSANDEFVFDHNSNGRIDADDLLRPIDTQDFQDGGWQDGDDGDVNDVSTQNGFIDDVHGWNFVDANNDANPGTNPSAHGTAVAGVATAVGENMVGVSGVSQNSTILPVRISSTAGFVTNAVLARSVYYAAGAVLDSMGNVTGTWRGADVINASWGGGSQDSALTGAFNWAANNAKDGQGIPVFVATGNSAAGRNGSETEQYNGIGQTVGGLFSSFGNSTWSWVLSYQKDAAGTVGEDTVRLGRFVNDDGTNTRWDSATVVPAGWSMAPFVGQDGWFIEDNPARAHGTGRYQARSTAIGNSDQAYILAPAINVAAANPSMSTTFYTWQSSAVADTMNLYLFNYETGRLFPLADNEGTYAGVVPTLVQGRDVDVAYPGNLANVIGVGATTDWDFRSHYAQYGAALDIVAPSNGGYAGVNTTDLTGSGGYSTGSDYTSTFGGTSAAAPYAAGIAALMISLNNDLTPTQIRTIMEATADKVGGDVGATEYDTNGFNQFYGFGRVNAENSVDTTLSTLGDFDRDQDVDGRDFLTWQRSFGDTADPVGTGADGDLSGEVDSGDLTIWQGHYGESIPAPLVAASTATLSSEESSNELVQSLPSNFFVTIASNLNSDLDATPAAISPVELDASMVKRSVFASLALPSNRLPEEHEFRLGSIHEDSPQEAIDEVFQALGDQLLIAFG